ncbi:MAG: hypothetical protein ABJF11_18375 [Reichenbachiella sp.]|uniref:hypothetical protein n=1 Tax=Reichenbachiella sp. TaxID=2184521 RepID=UPI003265DEF9
MKGKYMIFNGGFISTDSICGEVVISVERNYKQSRASPKSKKSRKLISIDLIVRKKMIKLYES